MICNHKFDYIDNFPLSTTALEAHITEKYGAGNEYNTHHYVDSNGNIVDSTQGTAVSNYQFEDDENEKKRRIKLISPELLQTIIKNFKDSI
jgi:hypothetical protein